MKAPGSTNQIFLLAHASANWI